MLFNSYVYFIFLFFVFIFFYTFKKRKSRNIFLLFSSYFFYAYWDWRFCGFLVLLTIVNFFAGKYLDVDSSKETERKTKKYIFQSAIIFNLITLGLFKYYNFFTDSFSSIFFPFNKNPDFLHLNLIIPLGISFYTFQNISYLTDIFRKKISHCDSITEYGLFIAFFPKLIAGPIERAGNFIPQLKIRLSGSRTQMYEGVTLIITGLFKKVMIGDTAGRFVDNIFGNIEYYRGSEIFASLFLFTIQIYADFSGYTNIARGTSKLFGIELMKNFNQPYFSKNITEFWRRWHISLSEWLRDYIYLPLSYSISNNLPQERYFGFRTEYIIYISSTMITFTLCGLWHGASWNFVIWGAAHGILLTVHRSMILNKTTVVHKAIRSLFKVSGKFSKNLMSISLTFISVVLVWAFFAFESLSDLSIALRKIIIIEKSEYSFLLASICISYGAVLFLFDYLEYKTGRHDFLLAIKSKAIVLGTLSGLIIVTFSYMFIAEPLPFVYFQF